MHSISTMKNVLLTTMLFCFFTVATHAQWRIISVKPGAKVFANGKPVKKGSMISPKAKIKFTKKTDYVRVYAKGKAPFTLKPGGGKPGKSSELVAVATSMMVPRKRSLASRGKETLIDVIPDLESVKIWFSGAPISAKEPLKKAKKLLYIGKEGKLYMFTKTVQDFSDKGKFFLVYKLNGKRVIRPVPMEEKDGQITITFNNSIYKGVSDTENIKESGLFFKPAGNRPILLSQLRPFFITEPSDDFKAEVKDLIPLLKETYGTDFVEKKYQELRKEGKGEDVSKKEAKTQATEGQFYGITDLFEDTYGGVPDRNSLKMWLIKNFPNFKVPGKKD